MTQEDGSSGSVSLRLLVKPLPIHTDLSRDFGPRMTEAGTLLLTGAIFRYVMLYFKCGV